MKSITPYLMFNGNCEEAIKFYRDCFDGEIKNRSRYADSPMEVSESDKNKLMHVELHFWGGILMASDRFEKTNDPEGSNNVHLNLRFEEPANMEKTYGLLGAGGKATMPIEKQFWGDKFGMLTDKFGFNWMFICPEKK